MNELPELSPGGFPDGGFPENRAWNSQVLGERGGTSGYGGDAYAQLIASTREFLDTFAGALPATATIDDLTAQMRHWTQVLQTTQVAEREQVFGHRSDLPGRGQVMSPKFVVIESDENSVTGTVRFGRFYLGGNGAVHGGAIPLLFDEVLGRLANAGGRKQSRTAYLHVNFRSITPIEADLHVRARFISEQGRKRTLTAELMHGDNLCADAEGLFVALNPGQP